MSSSLVLTPYTHTDPIFERLHSFTSSAQYKQFMHQPFSFIHNTIKSAVTPTTTPASGPTASTMPTQHDTVANVAAASTCRPECGCDGVAPSAFVLYGQYVTKHHSHHHHRSSRRFLVFSQHSLRWDVRPVGGADMVATAESRFAHVSQLVGAYCGTSASAQNRVPTECSMTVVIRRGSAMHIVLFECQDRESRDKWVDNINSIITEYKSRQAGQVQVQVQLQGQVQAQVVQSGEAVAVVNQYTQVDSPHRAEGAPPPYSAVCGEVEVVPDIAASSKGVMDIESDSAMAEGDEADGCGETLAEALHISTEPGHIDPIQSQYHSQNILQL